MNKHLALRILTSLADGRDPQTGVVLPRDHVFQQPDVIRALAIGVETVRAAAFWGDSNTPKRAGAGWTEDEERQLRLAFHAGKPMLEIADKHQRTVCAVASRLESLGCINEEVRRFSVYKPEPPSRERHSGDARHGAPKAAQAAIQHPVPGTTVDQGGRRRSAVPAGVPGNSPEPGVDRSNGGKA